MPQRLAPYAVSMAVNEKTIVSRCAEFGTDISPDPVFMASNDNRTCESTPVNVVYWLSNDCRMKRREKENDLS